MVTELLILDSAEEHLVTLSNRRSDACKFFEPRFKRELMGEIYLEFTIPFDHPDAKYVNENSRVAFKHKGKWQLFEVVDIEDTSETDNMKKVFADHVFVTELLDEIVRDKRPTNTTADLAMEDILADTNWNVGQVDVQALGNGSTTYYYLDAVKCLQKNMTVWGGDIVPRIERVNGKFVRYVDHLQRLGRDTGKRFESRKDIVSIKRKIDKRDVKTALIGRGKGEQSGDGYGRRITFTDVEWSVANGDPVDKPLGQDWVGDPVALQQWGRINPDGSRRHRMGEVIFDEETDLTNLLQRTWDELPTVTKALISYEMHAINLFSLLGLSHEEVDLGDTTIAINKDFQPELRVEVRAIGIDENLSDDTDVEFTFGNFLPLITDQFNKIEEIEKTIQDKDAEWSAGSGPIEETDYPDNLPATPAVTATGGFQKVMLSWDFDPSSYMSHYEVYASEVDGFVPDVTNIVFKGLSGGFAYDGDTNKVYYFRVRGVNKRGSATAFSAQVSATTAPILTDDLFDQIITSVKIGLAAVGTAQIENLAVTNAKIGLLAVDTANIADLAVTDGKVINLSADKVTFGTLDGYKANIININADNIVTGKLLAKITTVGQETTFENGYDPRAVISTLVDSSFVHDTQYWSQQYVGELVPSTNIGTIKQDPSSSNGPNLLEIQGGATLFTKNAIPVNTGRTYRVTMRVRQTVDPTVAGTSSVYAGVATLDGNYQAITGGAGSHRYCGGFGEITVADDWQVFTGTITGEGDTHNEFRPGTKYVRPMCLVNYSEGDGTVEIDVLDFEDITVQLDLETRIQTTEFKVTDESILGVVTSSQVFTDKANRSELADLASQGYADQVGVDANTYTDQQIATVNTDLDTAFTQISEVDQKADALDIKFTTSGGVNLIMNSVGYAGFDFWSVTIDTDTLGDPIGTATTRQNDELEEQGSGSGFVLSGAKITQTISTVADLYTFSASIDKEAAGYAYMKVLYDNKEEIIEFLDGTVYNYEKVQLTINPLGNTVTLELYADNVGEATFTNVMANVGSAALQWQFSAGELYNANMQVNRNGVKVFSNVYNGYTLITPEEFSGYAEVAGQMERVFTLNKDTTEVSKLKSKKEISMSPIKIVPVVSTDYNGWAFIKENTEV